tara:strand:- start:1510 stop:1659 length:150 start_codon:yes stop_codon:yes gene_type:complete
MSKRKIQPKFKNMTPDEIEAWEEKMKYLEGDNKNTHATNQIRAGRGWIF